MSKREDILSATLDLINQEGLQSTTIPKIFKKANVGSGTFYHYFNNKEELVNELFRAIGTHMGEVVISNYDPTLTIFERLKCMLRNIAEFALKYPKELWFLENYYHSPYISDESRNMQDPAMNEFFVIVDQGQKQGIIRDMDKMMCCQILNGIIISVIKGSLAGKYPLDEYQIQQTIEACWRAVKI
ncbi:MULTISPECIES: TetR/AcrR family transcriptional regulator [Paenibacillus]|uniref:TetR/AcrR family transcriptional regulator n=1 Tax=Paenibacillus TaxID=44249 RepID=UPI0011A36800|nr:MULTISPECIES: TetR/AcrR family transcriptional regulator [Paenibacillus]GIO62383.1 TetR family transcriptional regulator [Paenibacillus cineris]